MQNHVGSTSVIFCIGAGGNQSEAVDSLPPTGSFLISHNYDSAYFDSEFNLFFSTI